MSQEKVARYKEEKANRKEIMKKAKRQKAVRNTVTAVICVAVVGWLGYSAVDYAIENKPRQEVDVDYTAIEEYLSNIGE